MSEPEPVAWVVRRPDGSIYHLTWPPHDATDAQVYANEIGSTVEPLYVDAQLTAATTAARAEGAREALEGAAASVEATWMDGPSAALMLRARTRAAQLGQDADRG